MKIKGLYAIIDTTFSPQYSHFELANLVLLGGCKILQLRIKNSGNKEWSDEVFHEGRKIVELKKHFDFTFIINDYVDVAAEINADGVHVGGNDMSVADVRKRVGNNFIIGYSSSGGIDLGVAAEQQGADYIAFGAIYPTKTKGPGHPVQGVEKLKELISKVSKPVVAIGGINRSNILDVINAGADSVAMITGLSQAKDVVEETRYYNSLFK